mmetsp:Transcript_38805/g.80728  ORF Transcript_38805/g.80728 Transcript_38805/m.80728 type:complete len:114 (+) Transcript_38805:294-635(+)
MQRERERQPARQAGRQAEGGGRGEERRAREREAHEIKTMFATTASRRCLAGLLFRQVEAMDSVGRPIFPAQVLQQELPLLPKPISALLSSSFQNLHKGLFHVRVPFDTLLKLC